MWPCNDTRPCCCPSTTCKLRFCVTNIFLYYFFLLFSTFAQDYLFCLLCLIKFLFICLFVLLIRIKQFEETGILDYLKNRPFVKSKLALHDNGDVFDASPDAVRHEVSALSMRHMKSIFYTYFLGMSLAIILFGLECVWFLFLRRAMRNALRMLWNCVNKTSRD